MGHPMHRGCHISWIFPRLFWQLSLRKKRTITGKTCSIYKTCLQNWLHLLCSLYGQSWILKRLKISSNLVSCCMHKEICLHVEKVRIIIYMYQLKIRALFSHHHCPSFFFNRYCITFTIVTKTQYLQDFQDFYHTITTMFT